MATRPYPSFSMYKDNQGKWRCSYEAGNGLTIAVSSESYNRRADCQRGIDIMKASGSAPVWMPGDLVDAA
jgi:uncharacterized protein YegP (UPF0339 family)